MSGFQKRYHFNTIEYVAFLFPLHWVKCQLSRFFQPEGIAVEARETLLKRAAQGTFNFVMNKYKPAMVDFYFVSMPYLG